MKHLTTTILLLLILGFTANAQQDSLRINGQIGLRGLWQTGTLDQLVATPSGKLTIEHNKVHLEANTRYDFFLVNGSTVKNDLWFDLYFQLHPANRFYPFLSGLSGFSQSFRMDYSTQVALGIGANLIQRKPNRYIQANIGLGYFNLKYNQEIPHHSISLAPLLKIRMPFPGKRLACSIDLMGYFSLLDTDYMGLHNQVGLHIFLAKGFSIHLNHTTNYNRTNPVNIAPTNTKLSFGITYSIGQ